MGKRKFLKENDPGSVKLQNTGKMFTCTSIFLGAATIVRY